MTTPELSLIVEMADLFEVSIDALIGYEFRNNDKQNVIYRLKQYFHDRGNDDVYTDIEKSLKRYPNCFDVVYYSALIYRVRGLCQKKSEYSRRAHSLYRHVCMLIEQNTDPEISEISTCNEMADIHLTLGEYYKGLDILKQNNPCRLKHSLIGQTLASSCDDPEGAVPYLSMALLDLTETHMQIVMGYINVYCKTQDYQEALALVDWALCGEILLSLNQNEDAVNSLRQAKAIALQFDASNIRFVSCQTPATSFDDFGDTAMIGVDYTAALSL